ncbi:hypothetical protein ABKN59_010582 [Abortiporus biennis]
MKSNVNGRVKGAFESAVGGRVLYLALWSVFRSSSTDDDISDQPGVRCVFHLANNFHRQSLSLALWSISSLI